jgi:hypothetical protein
MWSEQRLTKIFDIFHMIFFMNLNEHCVGTIDFEIKYNMILLKYESRNVDENWVKKIKKKYPQKLSEPSIKIKFNLSSGYLNKFKFDKVLDVV